MTPWSDLGAALLLIALPAAAQPLTSGSATLDAAWVACHRQHAPGCATIERAWTSGVARQTQLQTDAAQYAGAEPPERRDQFIIERALAGLH